MTPADKIMALAIDRLANAANRAITHVAMANYPEREREAREWMVAAEEETLISLRAAIVEALDLGAPVAWYSAKVDDCITHAKKQSRAKVQPWDAEHYDVPLYAAKDKP